MVEQWKPVPGVEFYEVSNKGRVRKWRKIKASWKILKHDYGGRKFDYPRVWVCNTKLGGNIRRRFLVHRLVALAFIGPAPDGHQVNHKDGNKNNPWVDNLEYVTPSENHKHSYRELGRQRNTGSKHGMSKLDDARVIAIHAMRSEGSSLNDVAAHFMVGIATVSMICNGRTWKHLRLAPLGDHRLTSLRVIDHPKTASARRHGTMDPTNQL